VNTSLSLRTRLLIGAVFWTVGLVILASAALARAVELHPGAQHAVHGFLENRVPLLIALACMAVGFLQVRRGLSGVSQVRQRLAALHGGRERRLEGAYPSEVQPLVEDLNVLLDERDQAVTRAIAKAGDLAHGLKTPLAVLAHEGERAEAAGQDEIAASIHQQVHRMRRQVDYHLAHARAAASAGRAGGAHCVLRESVDGLVRALSRLHAGRGPVIDIRVDDGCRVRGQRADIDEMLGNLLDNACRWARTRVIVQAAAADGAVVVTVDDDGPGLAPEMWDLVLQRGVRADESGTGSGLGLAIVRDLTELYGGTLALGASPMGGLRAELRLPRGGREGVRS
jgi:signal transduction histidine kinase